MTHGYFTTKAQAAFARAGGDPSCTADLATWAETAHANQDTRSGVLVSESGVIAAHTRTVVTPPEGPVAHYISHDDARRYDLMHTEVGMATPQIARTIGEPVVHIRYWQVCTGPSEM